MKLAKCYASLPISNDRAGCILLEDFTDRTALPNDDGLSLSRLLEVVDALSALHAWCIENPEKWTTKFPPYTKELAADTLKWKLKECAQMRTTAPEYYVPSVEHIFNRIKTVDDVLNLLLVHEKYGIPSVICNGDLYSFNLLFSKSAVDATETKELQAILDWQVCKFS